MPAYSMPLSVHSKGTNYPTNSQYSVFPPECEDIASSTSSIPTSNNCKYSTTSSSYLNIYGDYESTGSAGDMNFQENMQDRLANSVDHSPLDRSLAIQAQTKLDAKHHELLELQRKAQARLAKTLERFQQGTRDTYEVRNDLEWTKEKVRSLKSKASRKHAKDYSKACARYPPPRTRGILCKCFFGSDDHISCVRQKGLAFGKVI
ncbi:hypothetical protein B0T10DRAFT_594799 [Thelonectria olida]|uniref:Biogenesis of lysosome-related organelles complex 1 subunit KXD1 n=1 Tax=Thelonectria olida TaxID=1576542 RepID=A0A9P8VR78_9HYPO|nr:hypothetical protein B0T10DRAFT_594799 [Thelonectria olida]